MRNITEYLDNAQNEQEINESFLSVGLTIIVAIILAKFTFTGIACLSLIVKGIKEGIKEGKEYATAINELNQLLQPYKNDLMNTKWGSKLFTENGIINNKSVNQKGCGIIYTELEEDIKNTLSAEDYKKYEEIIKPIAKQELDKLKQELYRNI